MSGGSSDEDETSTVTWRELLEGAIATLRSRDPGDGSDPATDARHHRRALGVADAELCCTCRRATRAASHLGAMVARRDRRAAAYVLGHWPFRHLDLMVDRRVLIPDPRPSRWSRGPAELDRIGGGIGEATVVDLGTGSGAIALAVATERVRTAVWATDASTDALEVARANLAGVGRAGARVRIAHGEWFDALPEELGGTVDLVVSNPPYVAANADLSPSVAEWEPAGALFAGADGLDDLRVILAEAPGWLVPDGVVVCELSPEQGAAAVELAGEHFDEVFLAGPDRRDRASSPATRSVRRFTTSTL